jgi:ketosteroid isomerase-like protein
MKNLLIAGLLFLLGPGLQAADAAIEATHNELRALRDGIMNAMNQGDLDKQLAWVHPNVVVTWHNAEVSRGHDGIRQYYKRLTEGPDKMVAAFSAEVKVDELTILHGGDTGIAFGSSIEHFTLTSGRKFDLEGRWSATMVKEGGRWLVANLHVSTNIFDNVMLNALKRQIFWIAGVALLLGAGFGWLMGRRRAKAT